MSRRGRRSARNRAARSAIVIDHDDNGEPRANGGGGCGGATFIIAIAIILTGAYFLLGNFGIWDAIPLRWAHIWPSALIALGLWQIVRSRGPDKGGIALIAVGGFFILNAAGVIPAGIWGYVWPLVLIAVGVALIAPFVIKRWLRR